VQRYAPMLRVAVPYGELSSAQVRVLAKIAREYDRPDAALLAEAQATQDRISDFPAPRLKSGYGHFSTRQNVQFNWIPLDQVRRRDGPAGQRAPARHPDQRQLHPQHHQ
jgi:sulfite reductase (NADPH) hemoprotein beta-component